MYVLSTRTEQMTSSLIRKKYSLQPYNVVPSDTGVLTNFQEIGGQFGIGSTQSSSNIACRNQ
jgi:hypothetical protein